MNNTVRTGKLKDVINAGNEEANLESLCEAFKEALLEKLKASETKYGWNGGWKFDSYTEEQLQKDLQLHIQKGDPIDVAAYCAFAWFHKYKTTPNKPL